MKYHLLMGSCLFIWLWGCSRECPVWYADTDGDGFGNFAVHQIACDAPPGYVSNADDCDDTDSGWHHFEPVVFDHVVVDDYCPQDAPWEQRYYSRIGTDRGRMGSEADSASFPIGGCAAQVQVSNPGNWEGVWTRLLHSGTDPDNLLDPQKLLGPYVNPQYQVYLTGIEIDVEGTGTLKVELKGAQPNAPPLFQSSVAMSGVPQTLNFPVNLIESIKELNWLVDGVGQATVTGLRLTVDSSHDFTTDEAAFLWSYGHFSQAYDPVSHLVRDRANWPAGDFDAVQSTGMFALATAVAADLGYVDASVATQIVSDIAATLVALPRQIDSGLLPHFLTNGQITCDTEWSSVDTALALMATMLACDATGCDPTPMKDLLTNIAWDALSNNGTLPISHGYKHDCATNTDTLLSSGWDTWGAEAFLVNIASATDGLSTGLTFLDPANPKTWDGSGFNDELAALFFPMLGADKWGVSWPPFRQNARSAQMSYYASIPYDTDYEVVGLFGLSACEHPEPWLVADENSVYAVLGMGGFNDQPPSDGAYMQGMPSSYPYPFVCPHYAAMIAAEEPAAFEKMMKYLIETQGVFTPLNNVESVGIDASGSLAWNELKGSWNLAMQTLGAARAVYACSNQLYLPHALIYAKPTWTAPYKTMMP